MLWCQMAGLGTGSEREGTGHGADREWWPTHQWELIDLLESCELSYNAERYLSNL